MTTVKYLMISASNSQWLPDALALCSASRRVTTRRQTLVPLPSPSPASFLIMWAADLRKTYSLLLHFPWGANFTRNRVAPTKAVLYRRFSEPLSLRSHRASVSIQIACSTPNKCSWALPQVIIVALLHLLSIHLSLRGNRTARLAALESNLTIVLTYGLTSLP